MPNSQIGSYCKFSRTLKSVANYNFTADSYIDYWTKRHKKIANNYSLMKSACEEKLTNGLISTEEMIELVRQSKDSIKEKQQALEYLTGKRMDIKKNSSEYVR